MSSKQFCNEDSFESESDDDLNQIFSSSSSYDRSSIGSIPWAEDSIKKNQEEWEHIERMFYGEEDLPQQTDLRNEILEWRKAFPHLRINGKKMKISNYNVNFNQISLFKDFEETIIEHPSNEISKNYSNRNVDQTLLAKDLEKNLRISPVPVILRNRTSSSRIYNKEYPKVQEDIKLSDIVTSQPKMQTKNFPHFQYPNNIRNNSLITNPSSNSATSLRMPIITNNNSQANYFTHSSKINSSNESKSIKLIKSTIILPIIDSFKISSSSSSSTPTEKSSRSISAATSHRKIHDYSWNSASKLKNYK